jgi:hypothetical protein
MHIYHPNGGLVRIVTLASFSAVKARPDRSSRAGPKPPGFLPQPGLTFIKICVLVSYDVIVIVKIYKAVIVSTKLILLVITVIYQDYVVLQVMTQHDTAQH